ncbi:MAG: aminopeptidase, partial [Eubacterium sp.]
MEKENKAEALQNLLTKKYDLAWNHLNEDENEAMEYFCEMYKEYLTISKTERLCAAYTVMLAEKKGFKSLDYYRSSGKVVPGDKIYMVYKKKTVLLLVIGEEPLENGMSIIGAHIDAPRLDLKQSPLYEENDMAYFKTHYYGGIKKYQWVTIPLALHGTVVKKDGDVINISIGEKNDEPVFCITDLLPHLSQEQSQKKMSEGITGEGLNLIIGSIPYADKEIGEPVKLNILEQLNKLYGIIEEDFASAELEVVPAGAARDVGFDRSFIGSYGQDDRVCAFTATMAILNADDQKPPKKTWCTILADKEEIGSYGSTGMQSRFFENELAEVIDLTENHKPELTQRRCLKNSEFLSADVTAAVDPNFIGTHDTHNAPFAGKGLVISKYGGSRGKSGS